MLIFLLLILSGFLAKELLKKFRMMRKFFQHCPYTTTRHYDGTRKPGMYNIVFRSDQNFSVLVGFHIHRRLFDYHGYDPFACTIEQQVHTISLYLGATPIDFQCFVSRDPQEIHISSTLADQKLIPDIVCHPHWRQRLGLFG